MKKKSSTRKVLALVLSLAVVVLLFAGCGGTPAPSASAPAASAPSAAPSGAAPAALQTVDFSAFLTAFEQGKNKTAVADRTNIITADTTTTATINAPHGQTSPVFMLKGDPGTLNATSKTDGKLTTDPTKNSYFASVVFLKDGSVAQFGDGVYKFKMSLSGPQAGQWNNAVVFKDAAPQKPLSDDAVTKALAIVTVGGVVQIQRNYTDNGKVVKQDVVKDTGVNVGDGKYHYFILAMQDVSSGTNVKLWIDGKVAYSGVIAGVTGAGAIQLLSNETPMTDKDGKPQITDGTKAGTFQPVTALMEGYVGGYDDGPAVASIALDPAK